jgi:hypothetical protein
MAWCQLARERTVVNVYGQFIGPLATAIGELHLNTQSHAILNFFLLRWSLGERISGLKRINTILFSGALLPDLPIFLFFFWYILVEQTPQRII